MAMDDGKLKEYYKRLNEQRGEQPTGYEKLVEGTRRVAENISRDSDTVVDGSMGSLTDAFDKPSTDQLP